jgi:hypothetical protein
VQHVKDPSLLKGPERQAWPSILQPFTDNCDVSIEVKYSSAGRKTVDNQSVWFS